MIIITIVIINSSSIISSSSWSYHDLDLDDDAHLLPGAPPLGKIDSAEPAFPNQLHQVILPLNVHLEKTHGEGDHDFSWINLNNFYDPGEDDDHDGQLLLLTRTFLSFSE